MTERRRQMVRWLPAKNAVRAKWQYVHCMGVSRIRRVKIGWYIRKCRHTSRHWGKPGAQQLAWVHWDGNKHDSKVPYSELIFDTGQTE